MKYVWYVQDYVSMRIEEVFTTKKAAVAKVKNTYGKGRFKCVAPNEIYFYWTPDDKNDPACTLDKVPVRKAKRS